MGDDAPNAGTQTHYLNQEEEFRVEVKIGTSVKVTLTDGTAEIFGAELPKGTPVTLPGGKHAVFSWHGATIDVLGATELEYVARDTPMTQYLNLDGVLEERRKAAKQAAEETATFERTSFNDEADRLRDIARHREQRAQRNQHAG